MNFHGNYHSSVLLGRRRIKEVTWNKRLLPREESTIWKRIRICKKVTEENEECMNNRDKNLVSSKARGRMCHLFQKYLKIEKLVITVGEKTQDHINKDHINITFLCKSSPISFEGTMKAFAVWWSVFVRVLNNKEYTSSWPFSKVPERETLNLGIPQIPWNVFVICGGLW